MFCVFYPIWKSVSVVAHLLLDRLKQLNRSHFLCKARLWGIMKTYADEILWRADRRDGRERERLKQRAVVLTQSWNQWPSVRRKALALAPHPRPVRLDSVSPTVTGVRSSKCMRPVLLRGSDESLKRGGNTWSVIKGLTLVSVCGRLQEHSVPTECVQ